MTDRISVLIQAKNLSAAQFADEIGVQRSSISHLMSGRNKPSLDLIQKTLQRFPEVSTEWLLFGKGEMVRELNLFDSQARSGAVQSNGKPELEAEPVLQNNNREPTLFSAESHAADMNIEVTDSKNLHGLQGSGVKSTEIPAPGQAEKTKITGIRKESGEDSVQAVNTKSNKRESTIDQIIVFYDDRTFKAYSPGN
jgi:transcriptional regulator with XRE-family HTH domain